MVFVFIFAMIHRGSTSCFNDYVNTNDIIEHIVQEVVAEVPGLTYARSHIFEMFEMFEIYCGGFKLMNVADFKHGVGVHLVEEMPRNLPPKEGWEFDLHDPDALDNLKKAMKRICRARRIAN